MICRVVLMAAAVGLASCGSDASPAVSSGDPKKDAIALYLEVASAAAACDVAATKLNLGLESGDLVSAYELAEQAESACLSTPGDIRRIGIPDSLMGDNRTMAEKAVEACDAMYVNKWAGAGALKQVIDGDTRPSALAEIKEIAQQIESGERLCSGGLIAVAMQEGATEADLGLEKAK